MLLTASLKDGSFSNLGTISGKHFLDCHEDIKSKFYGFCVNRKFLCLDKENVRVQMSHKFSKDTHFSVFANFMINCLAIFSYNTIFKPPYM